MEATASKPAGTEDVSRVEIMPGKESSTSDTHRHARKKRNSNGLAIFCWKVSFRKLQRELRR